MGGKAGPVTGSVEAAGELEDIVGFSLADTDVEINQTLFQLLVSVFHKM